VFKSGEGQATMETADARNDLRPSVMRKETRKQAGNFSLLRIELKLSNQYFHVVAKTV